MPKVMVGDLFGYFVTRPAFAPVFQTGATTTSITTTRTTQQGTAPPVTTITVSASSSQTQAGLFQQLLVSNPYAARTAFRISENESPDAQDRVFLGYTYGHQFSGQNGLLPPAAAFNASSSSTTTIVLGDGTSTITTVRRDAAATTNTTGILYPGGRINRSAEVFGFEKACLDGNASVGVRVPIVQQHADGTIGADGFSDLSVILKYVLWRNAETGSLVSGGLMATLPTGLSIPTYLGDIHSTLLQPYLGYRWQAGNFYLQGFSSCIVPTDTRDITLMLNSTGVGYTFDRKGDNLISSLTPLLEAHVTTPLNHRGFTEALYVPDLVSLTGGLHVGIGQRGLLTLAATTPVTGPRLYQVGALAYLNWGF